MQLLRLLALVMCPIAIAYSMGQIINSVCLCHSMCRSVCRSVCLHSHSRISWSIFTKSGTEVTTSKMKNEFVGVNIAPPLPIFFPQNCHFGPKGPENPCKLFMNYCNSMSYRKLESTKTIVTSDFRLETKIRQVWAWALKTRNITLNLWPNCGNFSIL